MTETTNTTSGADTATVSETSAAAGEATGTVHYAVAGAPACVGGFDSLRGDTMTTDASAVSCLTCRGTSYYAAGHTGQQDAPGFRGW